MNGDDKDSLLSSERRRQILSIIAEKRSITVVELAALFPVSAITLRRDLDRLAAENLVERVHGGAMTPLGHRRGARGPPSSTST